jgi:hypothetical protein
MTAEGLIQIAYDPNPQSAIRNLLPIRNPQSSPNPQSAIRNPQ